MCRYLHMAIWSRCTIRVAIAAIYGGVMELSTVVQQKEKSLMRTIEESALVGTRKKPPSIQERKKKLFYQASNTGTGTNIFGVILLR